MDTKTQRGGKRPGSGRKPVADKKQQLSIYVEQSIIERHGGPGKTKQFLYNILKT